MLHMPLDLRQVVFFRYCLTIDFSYVIIILRIKEGGFFIMDKVEEICDVIEDFIMEWGEITKYDVEALAYRICEELNICEKCGAKLGGRNE